MQTTRCAAQFLLAIALAVLMGACTPALDWRAVYVQGSALSALMPCKPQLHQRQLMLAGGPANLTMRACDAAGLTWAIVAGDLGDPARVRVALDELVAASTRNLSSPAPVLTPFAVRGATPNDRSSRFRVVGTRPDGAAVTLDSAVFTHGTWVFQATVLGQSADAESRDNLFSNLRIQS